jgi:predicted aspartyl protease
MIKTLFAGLAALSLLSPDAAIPLPSGSQTAAQTPPAGDETVTSDAPVMVSDPAYLQQFLIDGSQRMAVDVMINSAGPFPFVVDTGSERTIISRELAEKLDLLPGERLFLSTLSGRHESASYDIAALSTANVMMTNVRAPALFARNLGAAGLLGIDSLQDRRVIFDFRRKHMELRESGRFERPTVRDEDAIIVTARSRAGRLILTDASIGGRRVNVVVDTGAQSSVGNLALLDLILKRRQNLFPPQDSTITSVTGRTVTAQATVLKKLELPNSTIVDLRVAFTDAHAFRTLGLIDRPALLLGMDALQIFDRVEIDFANRRVIFDLPDRADARPRQRLAALDSRWHAALSH